MPGARAVLTEVEGNNAAPLDLVNPILAAEPEPPILVQKERNTILRKTGSSVLNEPPVHVVIRLMVRIKDDAAGPVVDKPLSP